MHYTLRLFHQAVMGQPTSSTEMAVFSVPNGDNIYEFAINACITISCNKNAIQIPMSSKKNRNSSKLMSTLENLGGAMSYQVM